ncbi:MAG TPA: hypothetical protein VGG29_09960 [Caulobacteraceae bacterium]|jgi:hypothetical protein
MAEMMNFTAKVAGFSALLLVMAAPAAVMGGSRSGAACPCSPPPPPPPCGCAPHHHHHFENHNHNNTNVNVSLNVVTKTNVYATATANASVTSVAQSNAAVQAQNAFSNQGFSFNQIQTGGGGGGGGFMTPGPVTEVNLGVGGEQESATEEERTKTLKVVIQAFCFDDKDVPHPASQIFPEKDIQDSYTGEVYRCIAGAHMQVTIAPWKEQVSFEGGQTLTCAKGEALYHLPGQGGGKLVCKPQIPQRDCNERSLLRRFGAGIKILTIVTTEKYTAYHRESTGAATTAMTFDGGVGGIMN